MNKPLRYHTNESTNAQPHKYGVWCTQLGVWKILTDDLTEATETFKKSGNPPLWYYILFERQPGTNGNYNDNANLIILDRSK